MKKLLNFLPTHFTICLIVGIVLQFQYKIWQYSFFASFWLSISLVLLLFLFNKKKLKGGFAVVTWLFFVLLGMQLVHFQDSRENKNYFANFKPNDSFISVEIRKVLKSNLFYDKYVGAIVKVGTHNAKGTILINVGKDTLKTKIQIGNMLLFKSSFQDISKPLNPFQFDYKTYLEKQGIYQQIFLSKGNFIISKTVSSSTFGFASNFREAIEKSLQVHGLQGEELAVVKALLLGQRNDISNEIIANYTRAGAIHILAISGLHIGVLLLLLNTFMKPLETIKNGRYIKMILCVIILWCFAIITGLSASVIRAVTMFTFVVIGLSFQRQTMVLFSLVSSMFFLLLIHPMFVFDVGFQLSYLAVFSIVIFQPKLVSVWKPSNWFLKKVWQLFTVSISAQLGVLPISLYYFHQFPGLFLLSNIVIVPFVGLLLMGGILVIVLSLFEILPPIIMLLYSKVISLMNGFVSWVSLQESFILTEISFSATKMIISYLILLMLVLFLEKKSFKALLAFLGSLIMFQGNLMFEKYRLNSQNELILFNKSRKTIIGVREASRMKIYHNVNSLMTNKKSSITNYKIGKNIKELQFLKYIPNCLSFNKNQILLIDKAGIYQVEGMKSPIVILTNSPKINLARLIQDLRPKMLIADASNYKNQVEKWQLLAVKWGIPFHYTVNNGAFVLKG